MVNDSYSDVGWKKAFSAALFISRLWWIPAVNYWDLLSWSEQQKKGEKWNWWTLNWPMQLCYCICFANGLISYWSTRERERLFRYWHFTVLVLVLFIFTPFSYSIFINIFCCRYDYCQARNNIRNSLSSPTAAQIRQIFKKYIISHNHATLVPFPSYCMCCL